MTTASGTIGPLHFEDLDPKRFEDLVRQLVYDFRPWRRLEATGRAGSDDGFDARGYEMVEAPAPVTEGDEEETVVEGTSDRLWLIQCKRERAITPKKLVGYLDDIKLAVIERLHGMVFAAACDFSKTARDRFAEKCRALGVQEWHLWGKAELEDKLFLPENDGLLFAYFGISLTIRRRSQRADLRARLVMKRKANRILDDKQHSYLLLRSPDAVSYPYAGSIPDFKRHPQWVIRQFHGLMHRGLTFILQRYPAFLSDDGKEWDAAMARNQALPHRFNDPWADDDDQNDRELNSHIHEIRESFPEKNRAWYELSGVIRFEDILDIDEIGDEYVREPHIYVAFHSTRGPFWEFFEKVETTAGHNPITAHPYSEGVQRVTKFPEELRRPAEQDDEDEEPEGD
jgi:hypothetical protein